MTTILFSSINAQQLAQAGINSLNARQNKSIIMTGNVEDINYRKSVFPAVRGWMSQVFNAHKAGLITKQEGIDLFTFIRGKAVNGILAYRAKNTVDYKALALQAQAELAEVKAQLVQAQGKIASQERTIVKQGKTNSKLKKVLMASV